VINPPPMDGQKEKTMNYIVRGDDGIWTFYLNVLSQLVLSQQTPNKLLDRVIQFMASSFDNTYSSNLSMMPVTRFHPVTNNLRQ